MTEGFNWPCSPKQERVEFIKLAAALCEAARLAEADHIPLSSVGRDESGGFVITPAPAPDALYASPELFWSGRRSQRGAVYSLALILYEKRNEDMPPFAENGDGESRIAALKRRMHGEEPPPPSGADGELRDIIMRALSFYEDQRTPDIGTLEGELLSAGEEKPSFTPRGLGGFDRPEEELSECERMMARIMGVLQGEAEKEE
jgi:serine/threonine protein kinase